MAFAGKILEILKSPKFREVMEGGIDAAATPNIAGGGATDIFRALQAVPAGRISRQVAQIQPYLKQAQAYGYRARGDKAYEDVRQGDEKIAQEGTKIGETARHNQASEGLTKSGQDIDQNKGYYSTVTGGIPYGMGISRKGYEAGEEMTPISENEMSPIQATKLESQRASTDYTKTLKGQSEATTEATRQSTAMAPQKLAMEERRTDAMVTRANAAAAKARQDAVGQGELSPKMGQIASRVSNDLQRDATYKKGVDAESQIKNVISGLSQKNFLGDIAAMNDFQHMVDPNATVRAEDVKLIQNNLPFLQKIFSEFPVEKLMKGVILPQGVRDQMQSLATKMYNDRAQHINQNVISRYRRLSEAQGINFDKFIGRDLELVGVPPSAPSGGTVAVTTGGITYDIPAEMIEQFRAAHPDAQEAR